MEKKTSILIVEDETIIAMEIQDRLADELREIDLPVLEPEAGDEDPEVKEPDARETGQIGSLDVAVDGHLGEPRPGQLHEGGEEEKRHGENDLGAVGRQVSHQAARQVAVVDLSDRAVVVDAGTVEMHASTP